MRYPIKIKWPTKNYRLFSCAVVYVGALMNDKLVLYQKLYMSLSFRFKKCRPVNLSYKSNQTETHTLIHKFFLKRKMDYDVFLSYFLYENKTVFKTGSGFLSSGWQTHGHFRKLKYEPAS